MPKIAQKNHVRHSLMTAEPPYRMERDDRCPVDPIFRAFRMENEASNSIIVEEFIPLILDPEIKIRAAALWFFENFGKADDQGHLAQAYTHHLNSFAGIQDPWPGRTHDLRADLAVKLGTQGHLVELRRVRSGDFFLDENSVHLDSSEIPEFLPPEKFLEHYPKVQLNRDQAKAIQLGQQVKLERDLEFISEKNEVTLWCDSKFLGMGFYHQNLLQAKRLLAVNSADSKLHL